MSKPKKPSAAAQKAHPAPIREEYTTAQAYASACKRVSEARIAFNQQETVTVRRPGKVERAKTPAKRPKAGTSKEAADVRKTAFAYAYIANGHNGTKAAIAVGCPKPGAHVAAARMLKDAKVKEILATETKRAAALAGLTVDRTLQEVARLAYSDVRKLFDENGNLKPLNTLDDDAAAAIASVEVEETKIGGKVLSRTKKIKHWDKGGALTSAMRYHGLFEKDNEQMKGDNLNVEVVFIKPGAGSPG